VGQPGGHGEGLTQAFATIPDRIESQQHGALDAEVRSGTTRGESAMVLEFTTSYLKDSLDILSYYKRLGKGAIAQVPDEMLCVTLDNSAVWVARIPARAGNNTLADRRSSGLSTCK
jgi:hypothetical protein